MPAPSITLSNQVIYVDREDLDKTLIIKKYEFLMWILENTGIPAEELDDCFPEDLSQWEVEHRIKLRKICDKYALDLIENQDHSLQVYLNKETQIAYWRKPWICLKYDHSAHSLKKKLYYEVKLEWSTIFQQTSLS